MFFKNPILYILLLFFIFNIFYSLYTPGICSEEPDKTPTVKPTQHPINDSFYDMGVYKVISQFGKWEKELGKEEAIKKTIKWLKGELKEPPVPEQIVDGIIDEYNSNCIWIYWSDGFSVMVNL